MTAGEIISAAFVPIMTLTTMQTSNWNYFWNRKSIFGCSALLWKYEQLWKKDQSEIPLKCYILLIIKMHKMGHCCNLLFYEISFGRRNKTIFFKLPNTKIENGSWVCLIKTDISVSYFPRVQAWRETLCSENRAALVQAVGILLQQYVVVVAIVLVFFVVA